MCMDIEEENRADSRAPVENIRAAAEAPVKGTGNGKACHHCKRTDHYSSMCPKAAAERRDESAKALSHFERTGKGCALCGEADHEARHHQLAARDYAASSPTPAPIS